MSLDEAQDLFDATGDPSPATLYEVAAWLLAPSPQETAPSFREEPEDFEDLGPQ
jgi:hypothetical protein